MGPTVRVQLGRETRPVNEDSWLSLDPGCVPAAGTPSVHGHCSPVSPSQGDVQPDTAPRNAWVTLESSRVTTRPTSSLHSGVLGLKVSSSWEKHRGTTWN